MRALSSILWTLVFSQVLFAEEKTSVVLFLIDDLGQRDLGCYGSKYYQTPHIDELAKQGIRFTNSYAIAPVCSPTRAGLLTGLHPARLGLTDWLPGLPARPADRVVGPETIRELPNTASTLSEQLHKAGYICGHIGKWHLGSNGPLSRGFQLNVGGDGAGSPLSYFAPFQNKGRTMPGLEQSQPGEYLPDRLAQEAVKFLTANRDQPFFLYLPHFSVHTPLVAKKEKVARYKPGRLGSQGNPTFAAMVESMDEAVGTVLNALDDLKLSSRTLVIFTSDNGGEAVHPAGQPATYNGPLREGKGYLYEGGIRVPMIIRGPGVKAMGTTTDVPATSLDLAPTILEACGVRVEGSFDGKSLNAVLAGKASPRESLFWHYPHYSPQGGRPGSAVRSGDWKLIEFFDTGRKELFDLKKDAGESRNLAADLPEVVKRLSEELNLWRKRVGAKVPVSNAKYLPNPQGKDGMITLHSRSAVVEGIQLRYEPLPHKNTLGFWVRKEDQAHWEFEVSKPGTFQVEVLQGCGRGSGGSEVEIATGKEKCTFTVKDTGGFQAFERRMIGKLNIEKAGRHTLTVKPLTKPGVAVMDLRELRLVPASE